MTTQPTLAPADAVLPDLERTRGCPPGVEGTVVDVVVLEAPAEDRVTSATIEQPLATVRSAVVVEAPAEPRVMSADEQLLARAFERMGYVPPRSVF